MRSGRLKIVLDTSCLVPLFSTEHEFHARTWAGCERLRRQEVQFVVPVHAVLECFSLLTRMPPPFRLSPETVERVLLENVSEDLVGLTPEMAWSCLRELVSRREGGGRIYDAVNGGGVLMMPGDIIVADTEGAVVARAKSVAAAAGPRAPKKHCCGHLNHDTP